MFIQLTTGHDNFRAQGSSPKRNVSLRAYTYVENDGEGPAIVPLFAAYQKKHKGFGQSHIVSAIPATDKFATNDCGQWFVSRYEVLPRTEILLEYRHRGVGAFAENVEYLMLVADPSATLWQLRTDLPPHALSSVPNIFQEGRFALLEAGDISLLSKKSVPLWRKYLGLTEDNLISYVMDNNLPREDQFFRYIPLEAAVVPTERLEVTTTSKGDTKLRIKRGRRITIR